MDAKTDLEALYGPDVFRRWYDEVHLRDVCNVEGIVAGWFYEQVHKSGSSPYLAVYSIPDLAILRQDINFSKVPKHAEMLPDGKDIFSLAEFDCRFYRRIQLYEKETTVPGRAATLLSVAMQPAPGEDADFDAWYREEHLEMLSQCPGWRRSARYELVHWSGKKDTYPNITPRWLAIHEYEDGSWPSKQSDEVAKTKWSEHHLSNATVFDGRGFRLCSAAAKVDATI